VTRSFTAEAELEAMTRERVATIKQQHACWRDPERLCAELGIRVDYGALGLGLEGAAFADAIRLDPTAGVAARRRFTFYHEIGHHLLRGHEALYSIINDQYASEELFHAICERLCNLAAAEFLLPREVVRTAYEEDGFSVALIAKLSEPAVVSRVAACAQLAFCAPHACLAIVCRKGQAPQTLESPLLPSQPVAAARAVIDAAFRSSRMRYSCARGTVIPSDHILAGAFDAAHGQRVRGMARIPFKSGALWKTPCEAVHLGEQVFGFFHPEQPPTSVANQLALPF